ncbi:MAG: excinuclease ABC subunit UvrB [Proteobacteria bacterium]|nr:excinuclease ABC subunit UvrB [Pseudomonadota bacterium]
MSYQLHSPFKPCGDQPKAIKSIVSSYKKGIKEQTLLGVTGSGKTFTMAHVIAALGESALIIAPNKTLAGQLFGEFCEFFPDDAVEFFISYYDYFQPEAYVPSTDTYIAKDASINDNIDKMRHRSTQHLFEKPQVIIIASVSCIYGLGSPSMYSEKAIHLEVGKSLTRKSFTQRLVDLRYLRDDMELSRGRFRVRGTVFDVMPSSEKKRYIRVQFFGSQIEDISLFDAQNHHQIVSLKQISIYPNSHYISSSTDVAHMIRSIQEELKDRLQYFQSKNKLVEYQRLEQRVMQDIEYFDSLGYCPGVENYSRYLSGALPGEPPPTLLDYFPDSFVTIVDESHLSIPQIGGMYQGDRARKQNLVDFGFRLPSALDNRPLNFEEFNDRIDKVLYVSATPSAYELSRTPQAITEQIIRPTGLVDPQVVVRRASTQIDDLYAELKKLKHTGGKAFVLTLTKKMSEDLTQYFSDMGLRVRYLHSNIKTLQRDELLSDLRRDCYDVLVGINLLREGLDVPEITLVAILDADKEGFLRSKSSLIQMVGRAARNVNSQVIFYADSMTKSMAAAIEETKRRRDIQLAYNAQHGIQPKSTSKRIAPNLRTAYGLSDHKEEVSVECPEDQIELVKLIDRKHKQMKKAAGQLLFEKAHHLQKELALLRSKLLS